MPETTTTPAGAGGAGQGITKIAAVERALAELGRDASTAAIQKFVKERFNFDMSSVHVTSAKAKALRRKAAKGSKKKAAAQKTAAPKSPAGGAQPKKAPASGSRAEASVATAGGRKGGGSLPLDDVLTIKELVKRHGAESLRALIDAFAD